ncbi:hypothetical protein H2203_008160 [Taxawa tesnikishii (nom. ined.)]|nr:hypothetical protein H2203_008160 [Dothideales sp. JES 119]
MAPISAILAAALSLTSVIQAMPHFPFHRPSPKKCYYPGWAGIKYMFTFGDSYTTTGFNDTLTQPNRANPLGNPPYPGYTASNGPNWVDFLTTTYNNTFLETVNLAYGGATVDSALVTPYLPTVLSLKQQINDEYVPVYADQPSFFPWSSDNTLFGIFIGINDVGNSYGAQNASINTLIFNVYSGLVDELYQSGARNFLFLNGASAQSLEAADIADFNSRIAALARNLTNTYHDATTFLFDTNCIFNQVLDNPCSYPQTCPYKNTTDYCVAYENGTPSWYSYNATCGVPVDEYFWLNSLHPTFRMHNATASQIAKELSTGPCRR